MAWRDILSQILSLALEELSVCQGKGCGRILVAVADAIYTPLAPIDTGSGDLKKLASRLASIAAHFLVYNILPKGIDALREVLEEAERVSKEAGTPPEAVKLLEKSGLAASPIPADEPRKAIVYAIKYYIEAYEEAMAPRRRRGARPPSQQDAIRHVRRLLREIGRSDAFLARMLANQLRSRGLPV